MSETDSTETDGTDFETSEQRRIVRDRYADIAQDTTECCDGDTADGQEASCCSESDTATAGSQLGYSAGDLESVGDTNLGLGCGNPTALAALEDGETVLDLGSGGGFDCFLAAQAVGDSGHVIGVDMTPEMIERARESAENNGNANVEFRLGEIEHLPVANTSVDVIISNCVINLSPEKGQVFREAFRVLRSGGRLAISDVVQTAPFPDGIRSDPDALSACISGAATIETLEALLDAVGFEAVSIVPNEESETFIREWDETRDLSEYLVSARIEARKPER